MRLKKDFCVDASKELSAAFLVLENNSTFHESWVSFLCAFNFVLSREVLNIIVSKDFVQLRRSTVASFFRRNRRDKRMK
jgi:hypothetical protein